jgi:hypothetical protein
MKMNKYQKALNTIGDTLTYYMVGEDLASLHSVNEIGDSMATLREIVNKADSFEWIPFTFDEEGILNCELPDVDEEILVSDGDSVWQDTWCEADEGYELFSGIEIEDLAWRQLPKPYEENQNKNNC